MILDYHHQFVKNWLCYLYVATHCMIVCMTELVRTRVRNNSACAHSEIMKVYANPNYSTWLCNIFGLSCYIKLDAFIIYFHIIIILRGRLVYINTMKSTEDINVFDRISRIQYDIGAWKNAQKYINTIQSIHKSIL